MTIGDAYQHPVQFSQDDVVRFAEVSGDHNPLHLDAEFAATTPFKRPIIHGMLGVSVFSRVIGMEFPGAGSIYVKQTVDFLRPMFVDTPYEARFQVLSINPEKHTAEISTEFFDPKTKKVTTRGVATVMNAEHF
ncbi:MaoC family dehydratase [Siphonobacter aquaeclarae]|jgi:acyl dehydratase|uniref:MaoC like domain-containing protein n=1 Tax=Siphonobacter aquaeclarae TaxID=563176 RepID=A0A1G9QBZ4_9BACT|nr:MaoC family dehydratase [Siphonobacter aquaeclarae]MBO9639235.1 MaoC family dehydratase [Siphonobacter aquaeclarae]SDM08473.1 MaoC like domain-containing protein [Siphonobacter aquaeclarae]